MYINGASIGMMDAVILKVARLQYIVLGLILSGFIVLGDCFIYLWVGGGYASAYWVALVIIVPMSVPRLQSCGPATLQAMNKHGFRAWVYLFIAVINVIGSLWAVRRWGAIGCAAVTGIAGLIGPGLIMNIYYQISIKSNLKRN